MTNIREVCMNRQNNAQEDEKKKKNMKFKRDYVRHSSSKPHTQSLFSLEIFCWTAIPSLLQQNLTHSDFH